MTITTRLKNLLVRPLIAFWKWRDPPQPPPSGFSMNPTDNVQIPMNLVMPLRDTSPIERAYMVQDLVGVVEEVIVGLDNTQVVHVGRFDIVDGNLCMFSLYDGDFSNYIRDFIYNVGGAFDTLLQYIADPPRTPVEQHPDEFIDWVRAHDALRLPEDVATVSDDLVKLPRRLALLLDDNPNVQLFLYRSTPGFSAAQIRDALKVGW